MKNKFVAAVLAFCFGGIGIHWFYLGRTLRGVLYLIFSWTFFPLFLTFFEFWWLIFVNKEEFDQKFNSQTL